VNEGLLHESEARTNSLLRNDFSGAVVGVIGSGGSAPTGTSFFNGLGSGAVTTVVATGTEFGMSYIDVRWQGTATGSQVCSFTFNSSNTVPAATGQVWTSSCFVRIVAGNFPTASNSNFNVGFSERNGFTALNFASVSVQVPTTTLNRVHARRTLLQATTDNLVTYSEMSVQSGAVVDVTFRYYLPQLEQGLKPSSPILTTGSAVTRAADVLTVPAANLPYPTPTVIGPELVTNGTFDDGLTGWTSGSAGVLSVSNGQLVVSTLAGDNFGTAYQEISTVAGSVYEMKIDRISTTQEFSAGVATTATSTINVLNLSSAGGVAGSFSGVFVGTGSNVFIRAGVGFNSAGEGTAVYDNISVREINPLAVSIQMDGKVTYADENSFEQVRFVKWENTSPTRVIQLRLETNSTNTGKFAVQQIGGDTADRAVRESGNSYLPDVLVPFNVAGRFGSNFLNGANDGVASTERTDIVALPDLSATNLPLANKYNGTIRTFRIWSQDITDAGLVEATAPSLVPSLSLTFDDTENSFIVEDWSA
jgi:hypothetical protein